MKAALVLTHGGPEQIEVLEVAAPVAGPAQVLVRLAWAGLNFVDIYQREGRYPGLSLPWPLGLEGSGTVAALGPGVTDWAVGDRVAFTTGAQGSYAELIAVPEAHLVRVPAGTSLQTACAAIEQGLTAWMLAHEVARLGPGQSALVHAAAGGVGGLLVQLLRQRGLRVLGTVSSATKAEWLASIGVEPVRYDEGRDWPADVLASTQGRGVDLVFDSVGATTFDQSLKVLARRGHLVLFGAASGPVEPVSPLALMAKSATLTRPVLPHYLEGAQALRARSAALFESIAKGALQVRVHAVLPLAQAAQAQQLLASRSTQGKLLLQIADAAD